MKQFTRYTLSVSILTAMLMFLAAAPAAALPVDHYAANSVLAEGRWVKLKVPSTGVHYLSNTLLRRMGFNNPEKVSVYGTGGGMVPEALSASMADDLPKIPTLVTSGGIIFFGRDHFTWEPNTSRSTRNLRPYAHTINPYCNDSYYFLTDREDNSEIAKEPAADCSGLPEITDFKDRIVYEKDLAAPDETGRLMLGEDFRTRRTQTFNFKLPGNIGDASVNVAFGAKVTNADSYIYVSANGTKLPEDNTNKIGRCNGEYFIATTNVLRPVSDVGENLALGIEYSQPQGALFTARLDYIEVFYRRALSLDNGSLHFYVNPDSRSAVKISGASDETVVWDVTNPAKPKQVSFTLNGTAAVFPTASGYAEYVAVNPSKVSASNAAEYTYQTVANQDIHGMETPDMVIISLPEYLSGANRIADLHESVDSMKVVVLTPDVIYNEFSGGSADVSAFRKLLKMWYDRPGERKIGYCLLFGRPSFDNKNVTSEQKDMGYNPLLIWQSPTGTAETSSFSSDAYIAMLDDCEPGDLKMNAAQQRVAVGRIPVKSASEAETAAAKLEKYLLSPTLGPWRNRVMLIADDGDSSQHFTQTQNVYNNLISEGSGASFFYDRLYLDSYNLELTGTGASYPAAKARMMRNFNEGVIYTNYIGHANPTSWTHEKLLEWSDINSFTNPNLTFILAATCSFGKWDAKSVSGAEIMILNPTAGAIGMITPSRTVYIGDNGTLTNYMSQFVFRRSEDGGAMRWGDICRLGMNSYTNDNKLRFCMIGDPALRIPTPSHNVCVTAINGEKPSDSENAPVVSALSKMRIEGDILAPDGQIDKSFNGTLNIQLFDAEKAITTNGNNDANVENYNDHVTKLAATSVKVTEGKWNAQIMLPAEIDNNYTPALLSCYAWSDNKVEANGHTTGFYIFGMDEEALPDTIGPAIETFYLNTPSFADGSLVGPSPMVMATLYDDSGINVSEGGIGHRITLTLDGKTFYNDVSAYYTPDVSREGAGSIAYPLSDLAAGSHTLELSVWDNANNSSRASLEFNVGANADPVISGLGTDVNPASTSVVFEVTMGHINSLSSLTLEVFDLAGRKVWSRSLTSPGASRNVFNASWNLCDTSGARVPRGIYLYRATATTPEGTQSSKTKKLAVTAP